MAANKNDSFPYLTEDVITADPSLKGALPKDFRFAASTASYQIEGGWQADGKGPSIWDAYLHDNKMEDGDDAVNSYYNWKEDIKLLKKYGVNTYRFSVSWPRIRPLGESGCWPQCCQYRSKLTAGGKDDPINEKGIEYYSNLVDALIAEGITPFLTIFHWDLPQELYERYGGFENTDRIVEDFVAFARVLFERLGDRVKNWITINEVSRTARAN